MGSKLVASTLDAAGHMLLSASQADFDAATTALENKKEKDFVNVCTNNLGMDLDIARALYKALKEIVKDADWGWA